MGWRLDTGGGGLPSSIPPEEVFHGGFVDYNDAATAITPIVVIGGGADVLLTNDTLGAFTNELFLPVGVTSIWNSTTNQFDFSQLKLGDMVDIRMEVIADMSGPNSEFDVDLELGIGGSPYSLSFGRESHKTSGEKLIDRFNGIYIGDTNTLNNPAQFVVRSDTSCDVTVSGWYCKIIRRG